MAKCLIPWSTPYTLSGYVSPANAALIMLYTHIMVIHTQYISAACTSDSRSAVHCAPHCANTILHNAIQLNCYKPIAMQYTAALITYIVGGYS